MELTLRWGCFALRDGDLFLKGADGVGKRAFELGVEYVHRAMDHLPIDLVCREGQAVLVRQDVSLTPQLRLETEAAGEEADVLGVLLCLSEIFRQRSHLRYESTTRIIRGTLCNDHFGHRFHDL